MPVLDRYLLRELLGAFAAVLVVLVMVSFGGLVADLLSKIARGKLPAGLLVSQLGLRAVDALPLLLPLSLFLAVLLALGRLYRDSEMAVLASVGVGPARVLRVVAVLALPLALLVGVSAMWFAPEAQRISRQMIDAANRSLLVAGLEPGRFVELPGRHSVVYLAEMTPDGSQFQRLFVHAERDGRVDIVTARAGELFQESQGEERYLSLFDGFRVEGEVGRDDWRLMRFERNDIRVPDAEPDELGGEEQRRSTLALWQSGEAPAIAELHWRIGAPLATLLLGLIAVPLARAPPRSSRHGQLLLALLGYIVYINLLALGRAWLSSGDVPLWAGLWWVHGPALAIAAWMLWREQRLPAPKGGAAPAGARP